MNCLYLTDEQLQTIIECSMDLALDQLLDGDVESAKLNALIHRSALKLKNSTIPLSEYELQLVKEFSETLIY